MPYTVPGDELGRLEKPSFALESSGPRCHGQNHWEVPREVGIYCINRDLYSGSGTPQLQHYSINRHQNQAPCGLSGCCFRNISPLSFSLVADFAS